MHSAASSRSCRCGAGGRMPASTGSTWPRSAARSTAPGSTSERRRYSADPASGLRGRARLVLRAPAREPLAEADRADERLLLASRRDPGLALPRARPGRPLRVPTGNRPRRRPRQEERRHLHGGHRRRKSGRALHPGPPRARLRGPHRSPLRLPRDRGVRPCEPGRARHSMGRSAREGPLEHEHADAVGPRPADLRRVLVTGAGGQLGVALADAFAADDVQALTRSDWDVRYPAPATVVAPDLVLHAAAWTNVDGAEDDPQGAAEVNVGGTTHAAELGAPLVAFSTDYVFDGRKGSPYVESDGPSPLSAYGRTKLHGEGAAGERAWIVRSSWLFGSTGHNFVRTMIRLGAERDAVSVVDDQRGCPTFVGHLAEATRELVDTGAPFGVWHLAAAGDCTWADLAEAVFDEAGLSCRVRRISTAEFGARAPRPAVSILRSEKGAPGLPHWREGLAECIRLIA